MAGYKDPGFQERTALAQAARAKALDKFKNRPVMDEATIAARREAQEKREQAAAAKREERRLALEQAEADRAAAKLAEEQAAAELVANANKSEAEKKAERDARYAARKARKG
jgi:hypothetical protein